ncbi:hypothetical protein K492DRAFT_80599 [Lichtheimia hyalospora FSU 10163]|nr:hypothetical protein K492DRAFT_80599 [Lichtheimia hyalospora FSU 10163]
MHGLLLECQQDKTELLEQGVENPFTQDAPYPLPSPSYLLLYPQLDADQNEQFLVKLCHWPGYHIDSLIVQRSKWSSSLPSTEGLMDEWDLLSAYDEDVSKREKQFQRPEFFAKPRPKLIAKKRQTIDTRTTLKKNQDTNKPKPTIASTSRKATTPNRATNKYTVKKTTAESWESENKNAMKRRVWDRVMKRGFDKRSQQTRLLFQQIYTSVQYVFRRTINDEQVDTTTMIQAIEAHLDFYQQMNELTQGK